MNKLIEELFPEANITLMDVISIERPELYSLLTSKGYEIYSSDNGARVKNLNGDIDMTLELFIALSRAIQTT